MMIAAKTVYDKIQEDIQQIPLNEFLLSPEEASSLRSKKVEQIVEKHLTSQEQDVCARVLNEIHTWGPLSDLLEDESITEIMVNGPQSIWIEREGKLFRHPDSFFSDLSFRNCLDRLSHEANAHITKEFPTADGAFRDFRLSMIGSDITQSSVHLSLRRHPKNPWTFLKLADIGWCRPEDLRIFRELIDKKKNFLVVGSTGSGKTSVLNSFLNLLPENERVVIIEDTSEIPLPNKASMKLLTREDPQNVLPAIDQTQLVKRALRLRPDRIAMGEVRGAEAKDFLMALATGHEGSFGTLHAQDAAQALIRLEMLIQMGAPQWNLSAIRRLIQMSLDFVIVVGREASGQRRFKGAYRLCSLEDNGFLLEPFDL
ncbi:pilus assembly protein CpaF [Bdellovibrio bacteriovorus]|uniref:Pilus assembly protein CpaF n=1 Tax=Bdellovibrio bacteriovorus TaxID=959 RepID=A0A150WTW1_BDEBC|nr:ATPase, T2SS/T4P/T4SS family [Bdellovibrio bacteriovorus]KYG69929.1 pilus assembly protein CpaF [Bdellovibrio bacteriovorus]